MGGLAWRRRVRPPTARLQSRSPGFPSIRARLRPAMFLWRCAISATGTRLSTRAFERGAAAALVERGYARNASDGALLRVHDPLEALRSTRTRRACSLASRHRGRDWQRGQDGHQGVLARVPVAARRYARRREVVQQSLGRAADARAHARLRALWRVRDRHEPRGRDRAVVEARAAARGDHHHGRAGTSASSSPPSRTSRRRRPRSSKGSMPAAPQSSIATIRSSISCGGGRARSERALSPSAATGTPTSAPRCRRLVPTAPTLSSVSAASGSPTASPRRGPTSRRTRSPSWQRCSRSAPMSRRQSPRWRA